ncbi:MAG TPA: hypothetical protein VEC57_05655 [Candidatus Limnocylindrales bacterium]|nr:hypothetical protein [Candidatus Limnocylindrales bacterium]
MGPLPIFIVQLWWFVLAWSLIVYLAIWPWSRRLSTDARLSLWIAPQMFRMLGLGLLSPVISPGMPRDFAVATAVGDGVTATLAVFAFLGLHRGWRSARPLTWTCAIVGAADLLIAFPHANHSGAIGHLAGQWYVPVFAGPIMVVAHAACFVELSRSTCSSDA